MKAMLKYNLTACPLLSPACYICLILLAKQHIRLNIHSSRKSRLQRVKCLHMQDSDATRQCFRAGGCLGLSSAHKKRSIGTGPHILFKALWDKTSRFLPSTSPACIPAHRRALRCDVAQRFFVLSLDARVGHPGQNQGRAQTLILLCVHAQVA